MKKHWFRFLWEKPPREVYFLMKRGLQRKSKFSYDIDALLGSSKYMDPVKLIDRLCRYEKVISQCTTWEPMNFGDRKVLEIGSGPLLGWGPLAIFLGCRQFVCVEAAYDPKILQSDKIWQRYLIPHFKQLCAIFGPKMTLEEYRKGILERIECLQIDFQDAVLPEGEFDLVLSNSVLEHVFNLGAFTKNLKRVSHSEARQFHAVDFSNHLMTEDPFEGIYSLSREDGVKKYSKTLNLMKPSEILETFQKSGFEVSLIPYLNFESPLLRDCHPQWRQFDTKDLQVGVAFIVGKSLP